VTDPVVGVGPGAPALGAGVSRLHPAAASAAAAAVPPASVAVFLSQWRRSIEGETAAGVASDREWVLIRGR
jgi:hypothetical protein